MIRRRFSKSLKMLEKSWSGSGVTQPCPVRHVAISLNCSTGRDINVYNPVVWLYNDKAWFPEHYTNRTVSFREVVFKTKKVNKHTMTQATTTTMSCLIKERSRISGRNYNYTICLPPPPHPLSCLFCFTGWFICFADWLICSLFSPNYPHRGPPPVLFPFFVNCFFLFFSFFSASSSPFLFYSS